MKKLDDETRYILATRLKMSDNDIEKYEKGLKSLSHMDESIIKSTKLLRKIGKEMSEAAPILDKCDLFNANKMLFKIAHKIGEVRGKGTLLLEDNIELMTKLNEYNIAGKMICECKNKVPRLSK